MPHQPQVPHVNQVPSLLPGGGQADTYGSHRARVMSCLPWVSPLKKTQTSAELHILRPWQGDLKPTCAWSLRVPFPGSRLFPWDSWVFTPHF